MSRWLSLNEDGRKQIETEDISNIQDISLMMKIINKIKCFFVEHVWLYCSSMPTEDRWCRECKRCGKRMTGERLVSNGHDGHWNIKWFND